MAAQLVADYAALDQRRDYGRERSAARARGRRFFRTVGVLGRLRQADLGYRPLPSAPDQVENDYYRFLNQPRD